MRQEDLTYVQLKAVENAREGITISDATQPGNPLVYVNKGFLKITGYSYEEIIGRNCRYLQGPDTDPGDVQKIREALMESRSVQVEILNYTRDGVPFWNFLSISPIFDENGRLTHFIGIQDDITAKKEKDEIEQKLRRQQMMLESTLAAEEKLREELGIELHDNINQLLATLKLYLTLAGDRKENSWQMVDRSRGLTESIIQEIRKLSKTLVTPRFEQVSFKKAVRNLIEDLKAVTPFRIGLDDHALKDALLSNQHKLVLYRILQEGLNNIIKHANARNVSIRISTNGKEVMLQIKDDGKGFDAESNFKGIGLKNMESRIQLLQGNFSIRSAEGKGCELNFDALLTHDPSSVPELDK